MKTALFPTHPHFPKENINRKYMDFLDVHCVNISQEITKKKLKWNNYMEINSSSLALYEVLPIFIRPACTRLSRECAATA